MTALTFTERLIVSQQAIGTIRRDAVNPRFGSKYATLDAIIEQVRPALAANGLLLSQHVVASVVETRISDGTDSLYSSVPVCASLEDAQRYGAALTYARRYGIASLLCLATDDDDDANSAQPPAPAQAAPTTAPAFVAPAAGFDRPHLLAATTKVHFGKNNGTALAALSPRQLDWYCDTWEPRPSEGYTEPHPLDVALKQAALDYRSHLLNPDSQASEADGIPF